MLRCALKTSFGYVYSTEVFCPPSTLNTTHGPELSLLRDSAHVGCSHLSKEALPASLGNKQPLPQQSHELLLGELPAFHLVGSFPIHATEKVCLSGFCQQEEITSFKSSERHSLGASMLEKQGDG